MARGPGTTPCSSDQPMRMRKVKMKKMTKVMKPKLMMPWLLRSWTMMMGIMKNDSGGFRVRVILF